MRRRLLALFILLVLAGLVFVLGSGTIDETRQVRFQLTGQVEDQDGQPVKGCRVLLFLSKPVEEDIRETLILGNDLEAHRAQTQDGGQWPPPIGYSVSDDEGRFLLRLSTNYGMRGPVFFGCSSLPSGHPFTSAWLVYVAPSHPILVHEVNASKWAFAGGDWSREPEALPLATLPQAGE